MGGPKQGPEREMYRKSVSADRGKSNGNEYVRSEISFSESFFTKKNSGSNSWLEGISRDWGGWREVRA